MHGLQGEEITRELIGEHGLDHHARVSTGTQLSLWRRRRRRRRRKKGGGGVVRKTKEKGFLFSSKYICREIFCRPLVSMPHTNGPV